MNIQRNRILILILFTGFFLVASFIFKKYLALFNSSEIETILVTATFLFSILVGFYIARLNTRYERLREHTSTEDALWLSIYRSTEVFQKKVKTSIADIIDRYYIASYDFALGEHFEYSEKFIDQAYKLYHSLPAPKTEKQKYAQEQMLEDLQKIEEVRFTTHISVLERLNNLQWFIVIMLAGIIIFCLLVVSTSSVTVKIFCTILGGLLVVLITTMRNLESFSFSGDRGIELTGQRIFEAIGREWYYPAEFLDQFVRKIPPHVRSYRVGYHKAGSEDLDIKTITLN